MEQETQKFGTTALLVVALLVGGLGGYAFGTNGNQNEKLAHDVPTGMHSWVGVQDSMYMILRGPRILSCMFPIILKVLIYTST